MAAKPNILTIVPYYRRAMDKLDEIGTVHHMGLADDKNAFLAKVGDKIDAIATFQGCGRDIIEALPNLKLIANFGVGYDGIDVDTATARGVKVTNTPDVLNDCVADLALGLTICGRRKLPLADAFTRAGSWASGGHFEFTQRVHHTKVGIVGLGRIGAEIAARCAAFKMEIGYHNRSEKPGVPYRYYPNLEDMARESDILIAITPGGPATANLIDGKILEALGPEGLLVNVARGSVVDMDALIGCLQDGKLGAAALDVFPDEPNVPEELFAMTENVVLTPHIASATHDTRMAMGMLVYDNIKAYFSGQKLLTPVN